MRIELQGLAVGPNRTGEISLLMLCVAKLDVEVWFDGLALVEDVCQVRRSLRHVAFVDDLRDVVVELVVVVLVLAIEEIAQDGPYIARGLFLKRSGLLLVAGTRRWIR